MLLFGHGVAIMAYSVCASWACIHMELMLLLVNVADAVDAVIVAIAENDAVFAVSVAVATLLLLLLL